MKNDGYFTIETALIFPFIVFLLLTFIVFTLIYHDFVIGKLHTNDIVVSEYFNAPSCSEPTMIGINNSPIISVKDKFFSKQISGKFINTKNLIYMNYNVKTNFNNSVSVYKKKNIIRIIDIADDLFTVVGDVVASDKVQSKIDDLKNKIKKK